MFHRSSVGVIFTGIMIIWINYSFIFVQTSAEETAQAVEVSVTQDSHNQVSIT